MARCHHQAAVRVARHDAVPGALVEVRDQSAPRPWNPTFKKPLLVYLL